LDDIVRNGHVTRGWIGVEPGVITAEIAAAFNSQENAGVIITGVVHGSPAAHAGVQPGDIITQVNEHAIRNPSDLLAAVSALKPGTPADLHMVRKSEPLKIQVTPQQRPRPATAHPKASGAQ
ncbi:MAG: PDZ domain-containing protein, partial [Comamonadaceae bacterium]|nr:PDZ domain-containing protein [Comamonadaceae bacterium]